MSGERYVEELKGAGIIISLHTQGRSGRIIDASTCVVSMLLAQYWWPVFSLEIPSCIVNTTGKYFLLHTHFIARDDISHKFFFFALEK